MKFAGRYVSNASANSSINASGVAGITFADNEGRNQLRVSCPEVINVQTSPYALARAAFFTFRTDESPNLVNFDILAWKILQPFIGNLLVGCSDTHTKIHNCVAIGSPSCVQWSGERRCLRRALKSWKFFGSAASFVRYNAIFFTWNICNTNMIANQAIFMYYIYSMCKLLEFRVFCTKIYFRTSLNVIETNG